jgi:phosphocarrier protein HPr
MIEKQYTIKNKQGLHARPVAELCKITSKFKSNITISKDGIDVNGKSVMGILMLAAEYMSEINVKVDGNDENELIHAIETLIENNFNE